MDAFTGKILKFIQQNKMLSPNDKVVVGFSGGADSTALLSVLKDLKDVLKIEIFALHVNHGIRQEAGDDEAFCQRFCKERGIELKTVSIDVPKLAKELSLTEEEAGRSARYRIFSEHAKMLGAGVIAVAHHENDVAETLLMNLARGTGLHGAGAIRPVRDNIIRPLLGVSRSEIEGYLKDRDISFCTDRTNFENDHTRNVIRNEIIPRLNDMVNERSAEHFARAAIAFDRADEFIRGCAKKAYDRIVIRSGDRLFMDVKELLKEPEIIRENVILMCFEDLVTGRKDITYSHVEQILSLLLDLKGTAYADLPYGLVATRSYESLSIGPKEKPDEDLLEIPVNISNEQETQVFIPGLGTVMISVFPYDKTSPPPREAYTKWFDYDRIQAVAFRRKRASDYILIEQKDALCKKELKKFFTDEKVPVSERNSMYLLAKNDEILWIPGYRMSGAYKVGSKTQKIMEIKIINGGISNG